MSKTGISIDRSPRAINRRAVLIDMGRTTAMLAFLAMLVPIARFLGFTVPVKPELVTVKRILKPGGFIIEPRFIIFDTESGPRAVSRRCTHLGCTLNYHELEKKMICPCHKSMFGIDGQRLAGPAQRDLDIYEVSPVGDDGAAGYIVRLT